MGLLSLKFRVPLSDLLSRSMVLGSKLAAWQPEVTTYTESNHGGCSEALCPRSYSGRISDQDEARQQLKHELWAQKRPASRQAQHVEVHPSRLLCRWCRTGLVMKLAAAFHSPTLLPTGRGLSCLGRNPLSVLTAVTNHYGPKAHKHNIT